MKSDIKKTYHIDGDAFQVTFRYADGTDKMCGTCSFMLKQDETDIIGVCGNDKLRLDKTI